MCYIIDETIRFHTVPNCNSNYNILKTIFIGIRFCLGNGGAVYISSDRNANFYQCSFTNCSTKIDYSGGGMFLDKLGNVNVTGCCGYYCIAGTGSFLSSSSGLSSSFFSKNSAFSLCSPNYEAYTSSFGMYGHKSLVTDLNSSKNFLTSYDCVTAYLVNTFSISYTTFYGNVNTLILESHCDNGGSVSNVNIYDNIERSVEWSIFELWRGTFYVSNCIFKRNTFQRTIRSGMPAIFSGCSFDENSITLHPHVHLFCKEKLTIETSSINLMIWKKRYYSLFSTIGFIFLIYQ